MFADKSEEPRSSGQRRMDDLLRIEAEAQQRAEEELLRARAMVSPVSFPSRIFFRILPKCLQEHARRRYEAAERAAMRAHLGRRMKPNHDKSSEPPASKRSKLSKRLESCPGINKVSVDDSLLVVTSE